MSLTYTSKYIEKKSYTNYLEGNINCNSNESHHIYNALDLNNQLVIHATTHKEKILMETTSKRWYSFMGEIRICDIHTYTTITIHTLLYFLDYIIKCTEKAWKSPSYIVIESKNLLELFESFSIVPSNNSFLEEINKKIVIDNYKYKKYFEKVKLFIQCELLLLSKYDSNSVFAILPRELVNVITKLQITL